MDEDYQFDVFISHVSEDKDAVARPLAEALRAKGLRVWYDEFEIDLGESIGGDINEGIRMSRYGVAVFSQQSIAKQGWADEEVEAFHSRQTGSGQGVVLLPVLHQLPIDEFKQRFPLYGAKLCGSTARGIKPLVRRLLKVISPERQEPQAPKQTPVGKLLIYLPDRRRQFNVLRDFISPESAPDPLPTVFVVHGDHLQAHDMYVRRLVEYTLPKLLGGTTRGPIKPFVLNWPEVEGSLADLDDGLRTNLTDVLHRSNSSAHGDSALNLHLAAHPGPVLVHTKLGAQDAVPDYGSAINAYCKFWNRWPRLAPQQQLFVVLLVEHERERRFEFLTKGAKRANRRLREYLETCQASGMPGCDRIVAKILPELGNISEKHADDWVRLEVEENQPERFDQVRLRINEVYETVSELPMDHFAQQVGTALTG